MNIMKMDGKSSEFVSFLLVTICLWSGFAFGADARCNFDEEFKSCFRNQDHLREGMRIERIFGFFRRNGSMQETCSQADILRTCIKGKTVSCRTDVNANYKPMFSKMEEGIDYVCKEKFGVFNSNKGCLQRQDVLTAAVNACQGKIKHSAHRRYARHSCDDVKDASKCVKDVVTNHCGPGEVGPAMEQVAKIFLALLDVAHDCDSGATFGVSRLVLSSAFILAILRWYSG